MAEASSNRDIACSRSSGLGLVAVQVILGILTLVYNVPVVLGVLHQGFGILLFLMALYFLFALSGRGFFFAIQTPHFAP